MKYFQLILCLLLIMSSFNGWSQRSQRRQAEIKASDLRKLPIVYVDLLDRSYPKSYLNRVSNTSVTLINRTIHDRTYRPMFFMGSVDYDDIKSITVVSRKRRLKVSLMGAAIGSAVGYMAGRQFRPAQLRQANIELISQRPQNGFIEPIFGAIVGGSIGAVVGDIFFTPYKLDDVHRNPAQAQRKLKEFEVRKSSRKKSSRKKRR